jgi:hypothetical protein
MILTDAAPGLRAEVAALERSYPGWHCWLSREGVVHATTCRCPLGGSGTTLDAPNPQRMAQVIAAQVHEWAFWGAA